MSIVRRRTPLSLALVALLAACDDPVTPLPREISVAILNAPDSMGVGDSVRLLANVLSSDPHWSAELTFASRAPGIVAVDSGGSIRGIAIGEAWIVARPAGRAHDVAADSVLVRITAASRSLRATVARDSLAPGDTMTVRTVVHDLFGAAPAAGSIRFASSDTLVASVDSLTGLVRVRSDGDVTITARAGARTSDVTLRAWLHRLDSGGVPLTQIALGWEFGCGLDAAGAAHCWGANARGQLGRQTMSTVTERFTIAPVQTPSRFTRIAAGRSAACGITTAGALECWGFVLQSPVYPYAVRGTPTQLALPAGVGAPASVAVGIRANACVTDSAGAHACVGDNSYYSIGTDSVIVTAPRPVPGLSETVASIRTGELHGCGATTAGALRCWGSSTGWGITSSTGKAPPTTIAGLPALRQVAAVYQGTCALDEQGGTWCGGISSAGMLVPLARVTGAPAFTRIAASVDVTCGLTSAGELWCWEPMGPLTAPALMGAATPIRFSNRHRLTDFAVGAHAVCGITTEGTAVCRQRPFGFQ